MAQDNYRKIKLVKLVELLHRDTDEDHPLTTAQLCSRLEEMGIICDRRTLSKDIALLNEHGYEILSVMDSHNKAYYVEDRSFSTPELKALIDAVQAASFITRKKTDELIDKISALGGSHRAQILKGNIVNFNTRKHSNESIFYSIDCLEQAIQQNRKVIFLYFDIDENGKRAYRRDGHHYVVEPVSLVLNEDNYYLVAYSERHDNTSNYRVDRMDRVEQIDEPICDKAVSLRGSIGNYTEEAFKMFGGTATDVKLRFPSRLLGPVYDKFGENIRVTKNEDDHCIAKVIVQLSPTFYGWVFQFAGEMQILSPNSVVDEYKARAKAANLL